MYTGDEEGVVTGELGGAAPDLEEVATHGVGWGGWRSVSVFENVMKTKGVSRV